MDDAAELGRLIRESRLKKGMSLAQLAAEVGRSSSSVRRWERGEVPPAKAIMGDLAVALDLEASQLDELRPNVEPAESEPSDASDGRHTTLEQPAVRADTPPPMSDNGQARPAERPTESISEGFGSGLLASYRAWTEDWSSWIRGALTVGVLLVMLVVLVWAVGELASALGEIWDSFDSDPNR